MTYRRHVIGGTGAFSVKVTAFVQKSPGVNTGFEYSRTSNPTRKTFEEAVAMIEGGSRGFAFASGSCAIATVVHLLKTGDHVVSVDDVYGGTNRFFNQVANAHWGVEFTFADLTDLNNLTKAITPSTRLIWLETPTNPTLKITDIAACCAIAHQHEDLHVVVDNTFMSPYLQSPLQHGADIVVSSVSKYIAGHADLVMGVAVTNNSALGDRIAFLNNAIGGVPSPSDCYLALRGLKTLHIRMERQCFNAMKIAEFLEDHEKVDRVIYPGLPSHPQHDLAKRQMRGFGGMITVYLKGGFQESACFLQNLKLFRCAESLGSVESLAEHPAIMTHAAVPDEQKALLNISDSMVRLSVGIENVDDLKKDLRDSLDTIRVSRY